MKDITNSLHFTNHLLNAHGRKEVTSDEDVVNVALYSNKLLAPREGGEPPWFAAAIARELDRRLLPLTNDIQTIKVGIRDLKEVQAQVQRIAAITYNRSCGTGDDVQLQVVPFMNGEDPTKNPHNLPRLLCANTVNTLNPTQRDQYYGGYYPDGPRPLVAKRMEKILVAIGANTI